MAVNRGGCFAMHVLAAAVASALAMTIAADALAQSEPQAPRLDAVRAEVSRTPFQQYVFKVDCAVGQTCSNFFARVPASSRLEITNVSCFVEFAPAAGTLVLRALQLLVLNPGGGIATASTLAPLKSTDLAPVWAANHAVSVFAAAGQQFRADAFLSRGTDRITFLACHISGQMVRLQ